MRARCEVSKPLSPPCLEVADAIRTWGGQVLFVDGIPNLLIIIIISPPTLLAAMGSTNWQALEPRRVMRFIYWLHIVGAIEQTNAPSRQPSNATIPAIFLAK